MPRLTVLTGIFPPDIGGPATSVPGLVALLAADGWAVTVVTLADRTEPDPEDPCPVVRVARAQRWPARAAGVARAVRRSRPDVVLANGLHLESTLLPGAPVVQKIVGDWAWERLRNSGGTALGIDEFQTARLPPQARLVRELRTRVTRRARRVIVPSRYLGDLCVGWGVPEHAIRVVPNAAPAPAPAPAPVAGGGEAPRALFVGRLVPWKHVDDVIAALPEVPALAFDVAGDGAERPRLEALAQALGVKERVRFLGTRPREEVLARMRQSALLVLPSSYEGMPHVVLEAFAAGLPVVASDAGGTPELVRDGATGFLFPCRDRDRLRAAIHAALEPARAAVAVAGGREVARRLTPDASAAATTKVLVEALAGRRQRITTTR